MTEEEIKSLQVDFNLIKQANMSIHAKLTIEFARRYEQAKKDKLIDNDGFVPIRQGGFRLGQFISCTGWCMKNWIDKESVTVVKPFFRCMILSAPWTFWLHDLGPTETLNLLIWSLQKEDI